MAKYSYDAWGKLLSTTGSMAGTIGKLNPFLYRGYYFDAETGLYYLNSRYYDAQTGRMINADGLVGKTGELLGHNLFAYCNNNPLNLYDPTGKRGYPVGFIGPIQPGDFYYKSGQGNPNSGFSQKEVVKKIASSTGVGDAIAGKAIKDSLKITTVTYRSGEGVGIVMQSAKNIGNFAKTIRGVGKVGAVSLAFYGYDVYTDFQDYNGWDTMAAIIADSVGLGLGVAAGVGLAALCAPLTAGVAIAAGATILVGAGISFGVSYAKDTWLKKR